MRVITNQHKNFSIVAHLIDEEVDVSATAKVKLKVRTQTQPLYVSCAKVMRDFKIWITLLSRLESDSFTRQSNCRSIMLNSISFSSHRPSRVT